VNRILLFLHFLIVGYTKLRQAEAVPLQDVCVAQRGSCSAPKFPSSPSFNVLVPFPFPFPTPIFDCSSPFPRHNAKRCDLHKTTKKRSCCPSPFMSRGSTTRRRVLEGDATGHAQLAAVGWADAATAPAPAPAVEPLRVSQARLGSCLTESEAGRARRALDRLGIATVTHDECAGSSVPMVVVSSRDLEVWHLRSICIASRANAVVSGADSPHTARVALRRPAGRGDMQETVRLRAGSGGRANACNGLCFFAVCQAPPREVPPWRKADTRRGREPCRSAPRNPPHWARCWQAGRRRFWQQRSCW